MRQSFQSLLLAQGQAPKPVFEPSREAIVLWAVGAVFGLFLAAYLYLSRNAVLKRKVFLVSSFVGATIVLGVFYLMPSPPGWFLFVMPVLVIIGYINIRTTRFCQSCGRTLFRQPMFTRPTFCPYCGGEVS